MGEVFRTPDERFAGLPGYDFEPHWFEADGLRLHYVDHGSGEPVVCFHGEPTWAFLYRKLVPPLVAAGRRVICPDYAGFGRSDKPTDRRWYSYERHVERSLRCSARSTSATPRSSCRTGAGPIGLRWAVENAERVARLAILNTGLFTGRASKASWRGATSRSAIRICRSASSSRARPPPSCPRRCLPDTRRPSRRPSRRPARPSSRCSCRRPTTSPAPPRCARSPTSSRAGRSRRSLRSRTRTVFPYPRAGEAMCEGIPGAGEQVRIEGAAHFLQEDRGERIAELIAAFIAG